MSRLVSLLEDRDNAIALAAETVRSGGVIVFPTDTVYGVGADAFNPYATARVFTAKGRPRSLPLPVLASEARAAWAVAGRVPAEAGRLADVFWPGALTLILPEPEGMEWDLGETKGGVAVRVPAHDDLRALLHRTGPLAMTSANRTGEPTPQTVDLIQERLLSAVTLYVDGGPAPGEVPSTIVDLTGPVPKVTREGVIPTTEILRVVGPARA